jgi:ankyrin repeat protein
MLSIHHSETVLKFLEYGPDCSVVDEDGNGVMHIALKQYSTKPDILRGLIKGGADVNLKNGEGDTPLLLLRNIGSVESGSILDVLLEAGADINAIDWDGRNSLFRGVSEFSKGHAKFDSIDNLVIRGASVTARDVNGRTIFHEAIKYCDCSRTIGSKDDTSLATLKFLVSLGLDLTTVDYRGNGLLHEFAYRWDNHDYSALEAIEVWQHLVG